MKPLAVVGPSDHPNGTEVTFKPSPLTFTKTEYDYAVLERRLRELAFLNSGLVIDLTDDRHVPAQHTHFEFKGGLVAFVEWLDRSKQPIFKPPISLVSKDSDGIRVELAMWWNDSPHEVALCFTNNIPQRDGGTHQAGFRQALTRVVAKYADDLAKKEKVELSGEDMREGLTAVLSVKVPDPKFSSQTKDKLVSSEVQPVVQMAVADALSHWFETHPKEAKLVIDQVVLAAAARKAAQLARELEVHPVLPAGQREELADQDLGRTRHRQRDQRQQRLAAHRGRGAGLVERQHQMPARVRDRRGGDQHRHAAERDLRQRTVCAPMRSSAMASPSVDSGFSSIAGSGCASILPSPSTRKANAPSAGRMLRTCSANAPMSTSPPATPTTAPPCTTGRTKVTISLPVLLPT